MFFHDYLSQLIFSGTSKYISRKGFLHVVKPSEHKGAGKTTQQVEELVNRPDQLRSILGSHQVAEEPQLVRAVL